MDTGDLRQAIDRELKALPTPRAPETLLPRVLSATVLRKPVPGLAVAREPGAGADRSAAGTAGRWYGRPWLTWPRGWQIASVVVFVALGVGAWMLFAGWGTAGTGFSPATLAPQHAPGRLTTTITTLGQASALVRVYWRLLIEPVAFLALVLALSLSLACAGIWLALDRDGSIGASQQ